MRPDGRGERGGEFNLLLWTVLLAAATVLTGCRGAPAPEKNEPVSASDAATSSYFVRLAPDADPRRVASDHGLAPDTIIAEERIRAFRALFTGEQAERLRQDARVRSVSIRIEGEGAKPPDPMPLPEDSSLSATSTAAG